MTLSSRLFVPWFVWLVVFSPLAACKLFNPPADAQTFQECCAGEGTCVPGGLIDESIRGRLSQDDCGSHLLCVPAAFAENSDFVPQTCKAVGDIEGRCMPQCLPDVRERASQLERAQCKETEMCVPCYDPRDGSETGICGLGADPGQQEPTRVFEACCGGDGRCVGQAYLARTGGENQAGQLSPRDCSDTLDRCVPATWLADDYAPRACHSLAAGEGRCIPECIVVEDPGRSPLPRDSCEVGEVCAPCYDPVTGDDTKVCRLVGDEPRELPRAFPTCCEMPTGPLGRCVERKALVSMVAGGTELEQLGADSCTSGPEPMLCVPTVWLSEPAALQSCAAFPGWEGRCLSRCLPQVADRIDQLSQAECTVSERCVPCYDPVDGTETGACRSRGDAPRQAARVLDRCCGEGRAAQGRCVPPDFLDPNMSSAALGQLSRDTCPDSDAMCVPEAWLDQTPQLASCAAFDAWEGRCLPSCVAKGTGQADRLRQEACAAGELCAPCFDPLSGDDTGVCRIGADVPRTVPQPLPSCCGFGASALGRCVGPALLEGDLAAGGRERLGRDVCTQPDALCVPAAWLSATPTLTTCHTIGALEGRCLPRCLPDIAAQAERLEQAQCSAQELCAPCFDPLTGLDTGVCSVGGDSPREVAEKLPGCCSERGRCVPTSFLASLSVGDALSSLGQDTCTDNDAVCVPSPWLDSSAPPSAVCRAAGDLEGRCMLECLPDVAALASLLTQRGCNDGERCVPCFDPQTKKETGVCSIGNDAPREDASTFATCCPRGNTTAGTCVPAEFLSKDELDLLPFDSCRTYDSRCVPSDLFSDPNSVQSCLSTLGSPGICLGDCFLGESASILGRTSCPEAARCVPCSSLPATSRIGCE